MGLLNNLFKSTNILDICNAKREWVIDNEFNDQMYADECMKHNFKSCMHVKNIREQERKEQYEDACIRTRNIFKSLLRVEDLNKFSKIQDDKYSGIVPQFIIERLDKFSGYKIPKGENEFVSKLYNEDNKLSMIWISNNQAAYVFPYLDADTVWYGVVGVWDIKTLTPLL